ncbi:hypothetical protein OUZ56_022556 [Daphnia magna]|uniref:Uncharacterized protein n=1 Tax=Daphnia magna TaxID=35525 RepID=A0ABR0AWR3_9CRUS|nr:hypothetical protein OUZ56_022556 [Daphnia magna]
MNSGKRHRDLKQRGWTELVQIKKHLSRPDICSKPVTGLLLLFLAWPHGVGKRKARQSEMIH